MSLGENAAFTNRRFYPQSYNYLYFKNQKEICFLLTTALGGRFGVVVRKRICFLKPRFRFAKLVGRCPPPTRSPTFRRSQSRYVPPGSSARVLLMPGGAGSSPSRPAGSAGRAPRPRCLPLLSPVLAPAGISRWFRSVPRRPCPCLSLCGRAIFLEPRRAFRLPRRLPRVQRAVRVTVTIPRPRGRPRVCANAAFSGATWPSLAVARPPRSRGPLSASGAPGSSSHRGRAHRVICGRLGSSVLA